MISFLAASQRPRYVACGIGHYGSNGNLEFVMVQIGGVLRFTSWRLLYNCYKINFQRAVVDDNWTVNAGE